MKNSDFDELMGRYLEDKVTKQERVKIDFWLDLMKTRKDAHLVLKPEEEAWLFEKITNNNASLEEVKAFKPTGVHSFMLQSWAKVAAALLLLVIASFIVYQFTNADTQRKIALYNKEKIILADGSIVWLAAGSKLTYHMDGDEIRHVALEGEGLFEIAKDAAHPFTIAHDNLVARVVGTSFNLHADGGMMEVKVLTGIVNLSSATDTAGVNVVANTSLTYTGTHSEIATPLAETEAKKIKEGTEYEMNFSNAAMHEVLARIEKKFDVKINVSNDALNACHIHADFSDHSLDGTFKLLSEFLNIEYVIKDKTVSISGAGCN